MRLLIKDDRKGTKVLWIFEVFLKHSMSKCIFIIEFAIVFYYFILYYII